MPPALISLSSNQPQTPHLPPQPLLPQPLPPTLPYKPPEPPCHNQVRSYSASHIQTTYKCSVSSLASPKPAVFIDLGMLGVKSIKYAYFKQQIALSGMYGCVFYSVQFSLVLSVLICLFIHHLFMRTTIV